MVIRLNIPKQWDFHTVWWHLLAWLMHSYAKKSITLPCLLLIYYKNSHLLLQHGWTWIMEKKAVFIFKLHRQYSYPHANPLQMQKKEKASEGVFFLPYIWSFDFWLSVLTRTFSGIVTVQEDYYIMLRRNWFHTCWRAHIVTCGGLLYYLTLTKRDAFSSDVMMYDHYSTTS